MIPLFLGLTLANLFCLCAAAALGYLRMGAPASAAARWHLVAGVLAAVVGCAVHCIVFTYFVATAKWIRHAIAVKRLDPALAAPTSSFKAQAFPAALACIAATCLAAFLGAAADNAYISPLWHHLLALGAIGVNMVGAVFEYGAVRRNGLLIDRILALAGGSSPDDVA